MDEGIASKRKTHAMGIFNLPTHPNKTLRGTTNTYSGHTRWIENTRKVMLQIAPNFSTFAHISWFFDRLPLLIATLSACSFSVFPFLLFHFLLEDHTAPLLPHLHGLQLPPLLSHPCPPARANGQRKHGNEQKIKGNRRTSMCKNHAGGEKALRFLTPSLHHPFLTRSFALSIQPPKIPRCPSACY